MRQVWLMKLTRVASVIKEKSMFKKYLLSFVLVLVLPFTSMLLLHMVSKAVISHEIISANSNSLDRLVGAYDARVDEARAMFKQLSMNPVFLETALQYRPEYDIPYQNFQLKTHVKMFQRDAVSDFFIYNANTDTIISSTNAVLSSEDYYLSYYADDLLGYRGWLEGIQGVRVNDVTRLAIRGQETICVVSSLPYDFYRTTGINAVCVLKPWFFAPMASETSQTGGAILVFGGDRRLLLSSNPQYAHLTLDDFPAGPLAAGFDERTIAGERCMVRSIPSSASRCTYISIIPVGVFSAKLTRYTAIQVISIGASMLISVLAAYFLSKRNTTPFSQLINRLSKRSDHAYNSLVQNEVQYIGAMFDDVYWQNEALGKTLEEDTFVLRRGLLLKLLAGIGENADAREKEILRNDEFFKRAWYAVALIKAENSRGASGDAVGEALRRALAAEQSVLLAETLQLSRDEHALIAGLASPHDARQFDKLCQSIKTRLADADGVMCSMSMSEICPGFAGIHEAYMQSVNAMNHRIAAGEGTLLKFSELNDKPLIVNYTFRQRAEQRLYAAVTQRTYEVGDAVTSLADEYFQGEIGTPDQCKCYIYDISTTVGALVAMLCDAHFAVELNAVGKLMNCDTLISFQRQAAELLGVVKERMEIKKTDDKLSAQIIAYMNEHHSDCKLCVNTLGAHFNMSASYLSKRFTQETAMSVSDVLAGIRLEHAKRLLGETDLSLDEIAVQVGIVGSGTLIRLFKKTEDMTPGAYRKVKRCLSEHA